MPATCFARRDRRRSTSGSRWRCCSSRPSTLSTRPGSRFATDLSSGSAPKPVRRPSANYGAFRFTRIAGPTPDAPDVYSPIQEGWVSPGKFESGGRPIWAPLPIATGRPYATAATYGEGIRAGLSGDDPNLLVLDRAFETQSVDPMFLEPECGLAWFDAGERRLEMVLGVQSPFEAAASLGTLLGSATAPLRPERIDLKFAYLGGGFGGRDHTPFPLYVALAAMFLPDRPVRLAHDRFQQFQAGVKRHAFKMQSKIGVDRTTGKITAFAADHVLDGGGLCQLFHQRRRGGRHRRHRDLQRAEGRRDHRRDAFARGAPPARCAGTGRCRR